MFSMSVERSGYSNIASIGSLAPWLERPKAKRFNSRHVGSNRVVSQVITLNKPPTTRAKISRSRGVLENSQFCFAHMHTTKCDVTRE